MKVNFSQPMHDMDGQPVFERDEQGNKTGKQWTLSRVCIAALLQPQRDLEGNEALKRFDLAQKIKPGGLIDVTLDDTTLIKTLTAKQFPPLYYGFVHYAFERAALGEKMAAAEIKAEAEAAP